MRIPLWIFVVAVLCVVTPISAIAEQSYHGCSDVYLWFYNYVVLELDESRCNWPCTGENGLTYSLWVVDECSTSVVGPPDGEFCSSDVIPDGVYNVNGWTGSGCDGTPNDHCIRISECTP